MTRKEYIEDPKQQLQEEILLELFGSKAPIVIFDIGACEGESSVRYSRLFPGSVIYTFEPLPNNFDWIRKNINTYGLKNIFPQQVCLSDKTGEVEFYVSAGKPEGAKEEDWDYGNKSSSLLPPSAQQLEWLKFDQKISVPATTLILFCGQHNIDVIDFIHMDVQGAELMVLRGAGDFMQHIHAVWLEVEAVELYKGQPLKSDVENFMSNHGFVKIADTVYEDAGDQFWVLQKFALEKKWDSLIRRISWRTGLMGLRKKCIRKIKKLRK